MRHAGSILRKFIREHGLEGGLNLSKIEKQWPELVGSTIAMHTYPDRLQGGTIIITVDSPQWMHHLSFFKKDILEKLSGYGISDVRLNLGRLPKTEKPERRKKTRELNDEDLRYVEETVSSLDDAGLRQRFRNLITNSLKNTGQRD